MINSFKFLQVDCFLCVFDSEAAASDSVSTAMYKTDIHSDTFFKVEQHVVYELLSNYSCNYHYQA